MDTSLLEDIIARARTMSDGDTFDAADTEALTSALAEAPYFSAAALLLLRYGRDIDGARRQALRERLSLTASDRRTLAYAELGDERAAFYPAPTDADAADTVDVIDTFLRTYGTCSPEEEKQLERMIFNPTPDYAELLARQEQSELPPEADDAPAGSQDALINAFIRSQHPAAHHEPEPQPEPEEEQKHAARPEHTDDSLLSESLAKIFIRQHRYERAFEIISGLSLKFPKKSAYFADQLRFLQKLIINQRRMSELSQGGATEK